MSAATQRARLSYEELYQLKWMVGGLLTLISLWTLAYLEIRSGILLLATALAILGTLFSPGLPGKVPSLIWTAVTPIIVVVVLIDFIISRPDIIPPLVRMIILLVMVRALQYRRRREDFQLILLCLFMVVISGVLTLSLTFGFQILIFTPCAMGLLFIINLTESCDRGDELPDNLWENFRLRHFLGRILKVTDLRLLGFGFLLFLGVVIVSSFFFIVTPRFRLDKAIPFLNLKGKARSGFSENINYGDVVDIIEDNSVALRVDLPTNQVIPLSPYWRMVVLDDYYNQSFRMSVSARRKNQVFKESYHLRPGAPVVVSGNNPEAHKWTFYLEGDTSRYLPMVGPHRSIRFQNRRNLEFNRRFWLENTTNISPGVLFYQVEGMKPADTWPADPDDRVLLDMPVLALPPRKDHLPNKVDYPQTTLVIPGDKPNLVPLQGTVAEITGGEKLGTRQFSEKAIRYLRSRHGYSLRVDIPQGKGDQLVRWLQSDLPGHCELFAGSFTLLARTAGFPTRVVTGFKGGSWSGFENYYMIRNRDAHAWCEIFDAEEGWIRVDPTPGSGLPGENAANSASTGVLNIDTSWHAYLDSLRILWYRRIVNFDQEQQTEIATRLKAKSGEFLEYLKGAVQARLIAMRTWFSKPWSRGKGFQMSVFLLLTGIFYFLLFHSDLWLSRLLDKLRIFGFDLAHNPIRSKAGKLVRKFREKGSDNAFQLKAEREEWQAIYGDLLALRFGRIEQWPPAKPVFRRARRFLKGMP